MIYLLIACRDCAREPEAAAAADEARLSDAAVAAAAVIKTSRARALINHSSAAMSLAFAIIYLYMVAHVDVRAREFGIVAYCREYMACIYRYIYIYYL